MLSHRLLLLLLAPYADIDACVCCSCCWCFCLCCCSSCHWNIVVAIDAAACDGVFDVAHVKITRDIVAHVALFVLLALLRLEQARVIAVAVGRRLVLFEATLHVTTVV